MLSNFLSAGLTTILFWIFIGIAIGGLIAWLLRSGSSTTSSTQSVASLDGKTATIREERTELADQLEAIEGVGPQIADLFHKNGVHRFAQIAAMAPADISKMLAAGGSAFAIAQPFTWPFQAKLLENGRIAEFLEVAQKLKAGRLPLNGLAGVGPATAERLSSADVGSVEALAAADPAKISAALAASGESIAESKLAGWIADAKALLSGDIAGLVAFFGLPAAVLGARSASTYTVKREVAGPLVNAQGLLGPVTATASTGGGSLLPVWLGLGGAALLALLGLFGGKKAEPAPVAVEAPVEAAAPAVPEGEGLLAETRDGKPALVLFFAVAKSDVTNELTAESSKLKDYLDSNPDARLSVSGYVDPTGDAAFNAELAKSRAEKVAAALAAAGIARERIDLDKPADIVAGDASYANDRKVEVTIKESGVVAAVPPVDAPAVQ